VSEQIIIRQAIAEDAEMVLEVAYTTFWDAFHDHPKNAPHDLAEYLEKAFNRAQISGELSNSNNIFLIAEIGGETAGYSRLVRNSTEHGITAERPIELNRLYSHQKFLGKGVGQALLGACIDRARTEGSDVIWLGVWEYNPRAQRFYERNGFRYVGKHVFQFGSDPQTDLLMQREL
jgi:GNAT superfamily N-acetyltransferase